MNAISSCSAFPWGHFDLLTTSDHRAVAATFVFGHTVEKKAAPRPMRRHKSVEHLESFKRQMRTKMADFTPQAGASPLLITQELLSVAVETMRATKPKRTQPRKEWIRPNTWKHMDLLHGLRKLIKIRRRSEGDAKWILPLQLLPARGAPAEIALPCTLTSALWKDIADVTMGTYIKALTRLTRYLLRQDKKEWMGQQCADSQQYFNHHDSRKAFELVKQLAKVPRRRTGISLALDNGSVSHDPETVGARWLGFWKEHFEADLQSGHAFNDRAVAITSQMVPDTHSTPTRKRSSV
eukprot:6490160-Amphidinium_carterae.3